MRFIFFFYLALLISCSDDEIEVIDPDPILPNEILITNEGSFSNPSASISTYDIDSKIVSNQVYQSFNNQPLGTILQDFVEDGSAYYAVMNVTGEIVKMDNTNFASLERISGFDSPRYMLLDAGKAYITDLSKDVIYILSLSDNSVNEIPLAGWTEDIILSDDLIVIGGRFTSNLYILDPSVNQIVDTLVVGFGPTDIRSDRDGNLWVYCTGESFYTPMIPASIYRVSVANRTSELIMEFTDFVGGASSRLALNPTLDTIYFTKEDIYRFSIDNPSAIENFFVRGGSNWYGLGVASNSEVYVSDAIDFDQNGLVYRLDPQGMVIDSFNVGVSPNGFFFP